MARRMKPSPALIVALIALFVSIGGVGYAASKIGTSDIKRGAVTKKKLHKKAVATRKIKRQAVKSGKIADLAVKTDKIDDQAVTTGKIADQAVQFRNIQDLAVGTDKLSTGAVTSDKIADQAVTTGKLVDGAITSTKFGSVVKRVSPPVTVANNANGTAIVNCLPGERMLSGGGGFLGGEMNAEVSFSGLVGGDWKVHARNESGTPKILEAQVHCLAE